MIAPTGDQYVLTRGGLTATITQVAAALRQLSVDGVALAETYPEHSTPPFACGIVLMPWPNRVEDGLWHLDGKPQQLDITEVARNNSLHGLLRYTGYRLLARAEASVTLGATVFPQHGYPFHLETSAHYELVESGLDVSHTVTNLSDVKAPVAIGTHPFLTIGDADPNELELTLHASTYFDVDERLNPIAEVPVTGDFDLRSGRRLAELDLDTAFGAVETVDGVAAVLRAPDGREVHLVQDENHPYAQVFTTREFPHADGPKLAVALEPMTAPPNAFNTGLGVKWLEPGESWTVRWGIRYSW